MTEKDSTVELLMMVSKVTEYLETNLGSRHEGDITQEHFETSVVEARKIDPRSTLLWLRKRKNEFAPEMIEFAQGLYGDKQI